MRQDFEEGGSNQTPQVGRNRDNCQTPQNFENLELREDQVKKKVALNFCSFVFKGLQEHYSDGWNWIDSAFLVLSVVAVGLWASIIADQIPNVQKQSFSDFRTIRTNDVFLRISDLMLYYSRVCSINVILIFIKVLKYLASWFERVMIIFKTLAYAKSDIFYFLIMYLIIFFAFVVMCHIYYGSDMLAFGSIWQSLRTLFVMLLGDLNQLDNMIVLNKVLSFFFFIAFMTSMQFILINMFIAFISNAYTQVNRTIRSSKKLEDELKQRHPLVRLAGLFSWARAAKKKKDSAPQDRQNMAKQVHKMLKLKMLEE